jgi:hypothetical protein
MPVPDYGTGSSWLDNVWLAAGLPFVLAVLLRLVDLISLPRWDELWTLLSARGWLSDSVPRIAEGSYDRAELYTIMVGWSLELFGDSLVVALRRHPWRDWVRLSQLRDLGAAQRRTARGRRMPSATAPLQSVIRARTGLATGTSLVVVNPNQGLCDGVATTDASE